jgi:hypothetical protein
MGKFFVSRCLSLNKIGLGTYAPDYADYDTEKAIIYVSKYEYQHKNDRLLLRTVRIRTDCSFYMKRTFGCTLGGMNESINLVPAAEI